MANVFQQNLEGPGVRTGSVSSPVAVPEISQDRDTGQDILNVMEGASRLFSAFSEREARQQQQEAAQAEAEAGAQEETTLAALVSGLSGIDAERATAAQAATNIQQNVFSLTGDDVPDGEQQEQFNQLQADLTELREADQSGLLDPYTYQRQVNRLVQDAITRAPGLAKDARTIADAFLGREQPELTESARAAVLQDNHMTQRYGSAWGVEEMRREKIKQMQSEQLASLQQKADIGDLKVAEIRPSVMDATTAGIDDVLNIMSTRFREQGSLSESDLEEFRSSISGLRSEVYSQLNNLVSSAQSNGAIIRDDKQRQLRSEIDTMFENLLPSGEELNSREFGQRLEQLNTTFDNLVELNVPAMRVVSLLGKAGGDNALAQLTAMSEFADSEPNQESIAPFLDNPTLTLGNTIKEALIQANAFAMDNDVLRDQLGEIDRALYDRVNLQTGSEAPDANPEQTQDRNTAIEEEFSVTGAIDEPTASRAVSYLGGSQVIDNATNDPQGTKRALAAVGRRVMEIADRNAIDVSVSPDGEVIVNQVQGTPQPTRAAITSLETVNNYLNVLDSYADAGIGGGRQDFTEIVESVSAAREGPEEEDEQPNTGDRGAGAPADLRFNRDGQPPEEGQEGELTAEELAAEPEDGEPVNDLTEVAMRMLNSGMNLDTVLKRLELDRGMTFESDDRRAQRNFAPSPENRR